MAHVSLLDKIKRVLGEGRCGALITGLERVPSVGAKLFVDETCDSYGSLGDPELDEHAIAFAGTFLQCRHEARAFSSSEINLRSGEWETARLLYERVQVEHALVICGAGHVGASLARLAALSGYRVTLIDDRPEFVQSSGFEG